MPKPGKKEKKNAYLKRAIPMMMDEGLDQKQAVGKAHGMWNTYKKGVKKDG